MERTRVFSCGAHTERRATGVIAVSDITETVYEVCSGVRVNSRRRVDDVPMRVLQSFQEPGPRTNPYIIQLRDSLASSPDAIPIAFSWRAALVGKYDLFHTHWPEALIERRGFVSTAGRRLLYALLVLRLTFRRIPVVSTVHNIDLPQGIGGVERWLLRVTQGLIRVRIVLNEFTPVPDGATTVLIEHGHYRDWFARFPRPEATPGSALFFGKLRRYKNVEGLLRAFRATSEAIPRKLRIVGSPSSAGLAASLVETAGADARIELDFRFVDDAELAYDVGHAALVVLPYPEMHNSGSVLAALSLDRPVLVPDNSVNRALGAEVGSDWVIRYEGELTANDLEAALSSCARLDPGARPDLSRRDWKQAGRRHVDAYRLALRS